MGSPTPSRQWGRLRALEGGVVVPPRYDLGDWQEGDGVFNAAALASYTLGDIREWGADALARATAQSFAVPQLDGFWVHVDADVLDPSVMPAVDSPDPDGLMPDELVALLRPLLASAQCVGLNVTIYDPDLDPEGTAGALLTDMVVSAFAEAG
ncbi:arginase family enzyme [Streptomyces sp. V4I2]|nr:arginase family enzyme [Streptomyces sp. V4I2]